MRICLISYEFLPKTGFGGAAALYTDLAGALAKKGHDITVLSGNTERRVETAHQSGVTNIRFGSSHLRPRAVACLDRATAVMRQYRRAVNSGGPFDIIESPDMLGEPIFVKALRSEDASVTRLITPHYLLLRMNDRARFVSVDWLERTNAAHSDLIMADSKNWGMDILNEWRIAGSKLRICPLGIDLERVDRAVNVEIPVASPYVLFAGRLTLAKGPQILAQAAPAILKVHPDAKIVFAGGDTKTDSGESVRETIMKGATAEERKSLIFTGFIRSWDQLVTLYRNASVCVKADTYGNHSFDALGQMACGKTLVCTKTEGNLEMITDHVNGFLFDREEPNQLAHIVTELLSDPRICRATGDMARKTVEQRYTSSICADVSLRTYQEAISARGN